MFGTDGPTPGLDQQHRPRAQHPDGAKQGPHRAAPGPPPLAPLTRSPLLTSPHSQLPTSPVPRGQPRARQYGLSIQSQLPASPHNRPRPGLGLLHPTCPDSATQTLPRALLSPAPSRSCASSQTPRLPSALGWRLAASPPQDPPLHALCSRSLRVRPRATPPARHRPRPPVSAAESAGLLRLESLPSHPARAPGLGPLCSPGLGSTRPPGPCSLRSFGLERLCHVVSHAPDGMDPGRSRRARALPSAPPPPPRARPIPAAHLAPRSPAPRSRPTAPHLPRPGRTDIRSRTFVARATIRPPAHVCPRKRLVLPSALG